MLSSQTPSRLHDFRESIASTIVVPVASGWALSCAFTSDSTLESVNRQVEMATQGFMEIRLTIRRRAANVGRFQVDVLVVHSPVPLDTPESD